MDDDQIINLSTFGEIIQKPNAAKDLTFADIISQMANQEMPAQQPETIEIEEVAQVHPYQEFIKTTFEYTLCLKMFHWQTFKDPEHRALDFLFGNILEILDELVEVCIGKYGRPYANGWSIPVCNYTSSEDLKAYVAAMEECYNVKCKSLFDPIKDSAILNILDELIAKVEKTKYLLTLEK